MHSDDLQEGAQEVIEDRRALGKTAAVIDRREKFARKRAAQEMRLLHEVSARVNHNPKLRVAAGLTAVKTMHHGTDLCGVIAKVRALQIQHKFHQQRFMFGRTANGAVLLVLMPDTWYCLCDWDDFVYPMVELPLPILETSEKLGVWEAASTDDDT